MSDHVQELLTQLDSHLEKREFEDARQTAQELREVYQDRRESEQERLSQSRAVALDGDVSVQESATLSGLSYADGSTRFGRVAMLTLVRAVTETHEELEAQGKLAQQLTTIRAAIEDLQISERELTEQASDSETVVQSATVPPTMAITETVVVSGSDSSGGTVRLRLVIKNVGNSTARDIQVSSVRTDAALTVGNDAITELAPDESAEATLQISSSETGTYSLELQAAPEEGISDIASKTITLGTETEVDTETATQATAAAETDRTSGDDNSMMWLVGGGVAGGVSVAVLVNWLFGDD